MVHAPFILLYATIIRKWKGDNRRYINISKYFEVLDPERCKALVAFHYLQAVIKQADLIINERELVGRHFLVPAILFCKHFQG